MEELEEAQAQLASAHAALNDNLHARQSTAAEPGSPQPRTMATPDRRTDPGTAAEEFGGAHAGSSPAADELQLRNAALQTERDEWRRRAEQLTGEVAALRRHLTAVCAEGHLGQTTLSHAEQARPPCSCVANRRISCEHLSMPELGLEPFPIEDMDRSVSAVLIRLKPISHTACAVGLDSYICLTATSHTATVCIQEHETRAHITLYENPGQLTARSQLSF